MSVWVVEYTGVNAIVIEAPNAERARTRAIAVLTGGVETPTVQDLTILRVTAALDEEES